MDKLIHLQAAIKQVWVELGADSRIDLIPHFHTLMKTPLVRFNEAYGNFISGVGATSAAFDMWLNVQMRIRTDVGQHPEVWKQLGTLFKETMSTTEGADSYDAQDEQDFLRYSFLVLLAFRIYLDALIFIPEAPPEAKK